MPPRNFLEWMAGSNKPVCRAQAMRSAKSVFVYVTSDESSEDGTSVSESESEKETSVKSTTSSSIKTSESSKTEKRSLMVSSESTSAESSASESQTENEQKSPSKASESTDAKSSGSESGSESEGQTPSTIAESTSGAETTSGSVSESESESSVLISTGKVLKSSLAALPADTETGTDTDNEIPVSWRQRSRRCTCKKKHVRFDLATIQKDDQKQEEIKKKAEQSKDVECTCLCTACKKATRKVMRMVAKAKEKEDSTTTDTGDSDDSMIGRDAKTKKKAVTSDAQTHATTSMKVAVDEKASSSQQPYNEALLSLDNFRKTHNPNYNQHIQSAEQFQSQQRQFQALANYHNFIMTKGDSTSDARLLQKSRADVVIREDVIENPATDPRPNSFFDSKTGVLRVYHGPVWGNAGGSLLPLSMVPGMGNTIGMGGMSQMANGMSGQDYGNVAMTPSGLMGPLGQAGQMAMNPYTGVPQMAMQQMVMPQMGIPPMGMSMPPYGLPFPSGYQPPVWPPQQMQQPMQQQYAQAPQQLAQPQPASERATTNKIVEIIQDEKVKGTSKKQDKDKAAEGKKDEQASSGVDTSTDANTTSAVETSTSDSEAQKSSHMSRAERKAAKKAEAKKQKEFSKSSTNATQNKVIEVDITVGTDGANDEKKADENDPWATSGDTNDNGDTAKKGGLTDDMPNAPIWGNMDAASSTKDYTATDKAEMAAETLGNSAWGGGEPVEW